MSLVSGDGDANSNDNNDGDDIMMKRMTVLDLWEEPYRLIPQTGTAITRKSNDVYCTKWNTVDYIQKIMTAYTSPWR